MITFIVIFVFCISISREKNNSLNLPENSDKIAEQIITLNKKYYLIRSIKNFLKEIFLLLMIRQFWHGKRVIFLMHI